MARFQGMLVGIAFITLLASSLAAPSAIGAANSPIAKVVTLIKEMKVQVATDGEEDTVAYDKYKCWCVTTEKEKTDAIAAAEAKLEELAGFLEEAAAKEAELKTEIAGLEEDIAKDKEALASATSMREKENKEFQASEADAKETLALLADAITTLSKVQLLQKPGKAALVQVRKVVNRISPKFPNLMQKDLYDMLGALESVEQKHLGAIFLPRNRAAALEQSWARSLPWLSKTEEDLGKEAKPNDMNGAAAGAKSYNSRSGGILGLLKQMGDNTAKNLADDQREELGALVAFQTLQAAKLAEIKSATEQRDQKELQLSELIDKVAKAKEDQEATSEQLAADKDFLARTMDSCANEDAEYASRQKARGQEIEALSETLVILTGDEARSLFDKTISADSFIQVGAVSQATTARQQKAKSAAMKRILAAAKKSKNWALASLAVQVNLDAFTKVKAAMDKMLAELKAQQKAEYEKGEQCKKDLDETEDKIKEATNTKEDLDQKHTELTNLLETGDADIAAMQTEVSDMEVSLKQAGEQRKANNGLYQQSMSDQRATIAILNMAAARLKKFYAPDLVQIRLHAQAAPPPKPSGQAYEKQSGGVMQMLATIVADAESVESELQLTEQNEQKNYAEFVAVTTESIEATRKAIEQKQEQVAQASGEKSETEESQLANDASLAELNQLLTGIHTDCDWILKYFDLRQTSRKDEMNAIEEAKAILSGANFS
jgi:hypothetical protein